MVRLGVTGLSRTGKTVFITSLVASLKKPDNMVQLVAAHEGRITDVCLPPPKGDVPS
ncbi:MAG: YcjX family protein, partial [Synechococcus sp. SB0663_bin_10]|nr:YcjX family protein [Synechococcus sp. SB0663_bin_10]